MVLRTGKSEKSVASPIFWAGFILEQIGRLTYRLIFFFLKSTVVILIHLIKLLSVILGLVGRLILQLIKLSKQAVKGLKKTKFPQLKLYRLKISLKKIKIKPPALKLPKIKLTKRFIFSSFLLTVLFVSFYFYILKDLPDPKSLITRDQILTTKIYDRHGKVLYKIYSDENRTLVKLKELPNHFIKATLAAEDSQFYEHRGFSWKGIFRSLEKLLTKRKIQGGSTITQQLVKNALLSSEKTLRRKIKEVILSMLTEAYFDKDEILQMYFNEIPYGGMAYGAEEAAQNYFNKTIREINLTEAALLAGLPAAPTRYSPFGAHPELAKVRQNFVLDRMVEEKYITPKEAEEAKQTEVVLNLPHNNIQAPHFVMYIKDLLARKYGVRQVEQGGLQVITSLDLKIQKEVEKIVQEELEKVAHFQISNGAALVTNPQTGEILAMVGSKDYFDSEHDGNVNVTLRPRQPGSAIKPVNYAVALESGYTSASVLADTPITYRYPGSTPYSPKNYDDKFHGHISLRTALASSYNVPATKVLYSYGVSKMIEKGQEMGITSWTQPERYGLALTLGGAEVKMIDMAVVYGTLANLGLKINLYPVLEVKNSQGKTLEKSPFSSQSTKVLSPQTAYLLTDILADNNARAPAFGYHSQLNIPNHQVAVKTGTTNNKRDNWTIGYTTDCVVLVWVGNNDNTPMSSVASGITGASPIWNKIMNLLLKDQPDHRFIKPQDLLQVNVCAINGLLPCDGCPTKTEFFTPGTEPKIHCSPEKIKELQEQKKKKEERDRLLEGISTSSN